MKTCRTIPRYAQRPATNLQSRTFDVHSQTFERGVTLWPTTNSQMWPSPIRLHYKAFARPKQAPGRLGGSFFTSLGKEEFMAEQPTPDRNVVAKQPVAAYIGIDWADQKHDICLLAHDATQVEHLVVHHTPEALAEWVATLRARFGARPVAVCLEQSRGPLLYALMKYDFLILYPVNPKSLAKFRETFHPSGAKDDRSDAELLLDLIRHHRQRFSPWVPDDSQTRTLALLVEGRRKAVDMQKSLCNTLRAALKDYFPQAIDLVGGRLHAPLACDFLSQWPTLEALQGVTPEALRKFYYAHACRRPDLLEKRIQAIPQAAPLTTDKAIIEASLLVVAMLIGQLRPLHKAIQHYDQAIDALFKAHPDAFLFAALPGAGKVMAPRLLAAFGADRTRFPLPENLQQYAGIAPVTQRSGNTSWVHWRWASPSFLRQTFHEFAHYSLRRCVWADAFYHQQLDRGKAHHAAIRSLAFKWIRILHRCWRDRVAYHEAVYLQSLARKASPLLQRVSQTRDKECA